MTEGIEQWQEFRRAREAELTQPRGWLTLTGFHWLPKTPTELGASRGAGQPTVRKRSSTRRHRTV